MAIRITPAVPTTPKQLPKARLNAEASKKATRMKVPGVIRRTPAQTKKATVPPARHRAVSRPSSSRIRSTFMEGAIPDRAILISAGAAVPRRTPTAKKQRNPTSKAQTRESPSTIHPATQIKKTPNAANKSIFSPPPFHPLGIVSRLNCFVTPFHPVPPFLFLFVVVYCRMNLYVKVGNGFG